MDESTKPEGELAEEFRKLGANLKQALGSAWHSPERERLEGEIRTGLRQAAETLAGLAEEAAESDTGQKLRAEIESLGDRVRSGELETKIRQDLMDALQKLNADLERARARRAQTTASTPSEPEA